MSHDILTGSYIINGISGIWNSYGCPVDPGEGLSIFLEDNEIADKSLIDLVGFDKSKKYIGLLKNEKIISELVVMLPMLQYEIEYTELPPEDPVYMPPPDPCAPCDEKGDPCPDKYSVYSLGEWYFPDGNPQSLANPDITYWSEDTPRNSGVTLPAELQKYRGRLKYCRTEDAWLFTIDQSIINKILDTEDYKKLNIKDIKSILDNKKNLNNNNNIVKLMKAMVKYNFPPHLNWLLFPDSVPPYAMYAAEFSTTLNRGDLSDIWQGSMPTIAKEPQEEEIIIEHFLTDEEIFGGFDIANIDNIKLSIFKCKMRASNNYYEIGKIAFSKDLQLSDAIERNKWYQYNWPYDNFSLVELLKVDGGEVRDFIKLEDISDSVLITTETTGGSVQQQTPRERYNEYVAASAAYTPDLYK